MKDNNYDIKGVELPYIIAEPCVSTCDTACVEVCPVGIHGPNDKTGLELRQRSLVLIQLISSCI